MAYAGISVTLGQSLPGGRFSTTHGAASDVTAYSSVASAIATLVADGASPTQAHVTTLNTAWTTLKAALDTHAAADVSLLYNTATVNTTNKGSSALRAIEQQFIGRLTVG
jgi:hypothetical protein